jgi:CBS domain-containing protein
MNLAIFIDAHPVSGDASLLVAAREHALSLATQSDIFIARLASAVNQFKAPSRWRARLTELCGSATQTFDLKKLGTFPIVHGVRALALEHRLDALNTAERLRELARQNVVTTALARDLTETLHLMMTFKLRENLRQIAAGKPVSNVVELSSLGTLDRDVLQGSLAIVDQFRLNLRLHFRLEALGA